MESMSSVCLQTKFCNGFDMVVAERMTFYQVCDLATLDDSFLVI